MEQAAKFRRVLEKTGFFLVGINLFHLSVNKVFNSYGIFLNAY